MVSSLMGLRRSSSLTRSENKKQNSTKGDSLLSLLSPKMDESYSANGNLKRSTSSASSSSEHSVIIRRSNSIGSDKSYGASYDLASPLEELPLEFHDDDDPFDNDMLLQDPPLLPPKELHPGRLYALYEFSGPDPSQCDLEYDDAVVLLNDDDSYWWLIKRAKDGKIGFAPAECLETPGERLARLNCWKNEELERISKEESKKKLKSLLSLTRKASKLANNSSHELGKSGTVKKKNSSRNVVFAESVSYSETAFISDSEDEDYEDDDEEFEEEEQEQEQKIDDIVNYSDDNNTLDGDQEEASDSGPGTPEVTSPLMVLKIRKKSIDNLKSSLVFKSKEKRAPTPAEIKGKNLTIDKLTKEQQNKLLEPTPTAPKRNSMLSISDDDASLYNRTSLLYDNERRLQDLESILAQAVSSNSATPPKTAINPPSSHGKRAASNTASIKTVSLSYSIGDYSPSSSEFESDTQTPTKFNVLNSLQLLTSTINNGGLKGKLSNSSSINQMSSKKVIHDDDDDYLSEITDNIDLESIENRDNESLGSPVNLFDDNNDLAKDTISEIDKQLEELGGKKPGKLLLSPSKSLSKSKNNRLQTENIQELNIDEGDDNDTLGRSSPTSPIMINSTKANSNSTTITAGSKFSPTNLTPNSSFTSLSSSLIQQEKKAKQQEESHITPVTSSLVSDLNTRKLDTDTGSNNTSIILNTNESLCSLLEDYHPDINQLFYPLFSKADTLTTQLADLKRLLVG